MCSSDLWIAAPSGRNPGAARRFRLPPEWVIGYLARFPCDACQTGSHAVPYSSLPACFKADVHPGCRLHSDLACTRNRCRQEGGPPPDLGQVCTTRAASASSAFLALLTPSLLRAGFCQTRSLLAGAGRRWEVGSLLSVVVVCRAKGSAGVMPCRVGWVVA